MDMRSSARICVVMWITILTCWACAGSKDTLKNIPTTINSIKPAKGLHKKIAVFLAQAPSSAIGRQIGDRYFQSMVGALRRQDSGLRLVARPDADWPENLDTMLRTLETSGNALMVAEKLRSAGYNGWISARIEDMWPVAKKTGLLWFRKDRYFIYLELSLAVYDSFTGAKVMDRVVETSTKIGEDDFNAFKNGEDLEIEDLNEAIDDIAAESGENAAEALQDQPWQTSVVGVENGRIFLPAGMPSGLKNGDRLVVFEGRRIIEGQNGQQFIVPGNKVGEIEIVRVAEQMSEARSRAGLDGTGIQVGDIAVAVK